MMQIILSGALPGLLTAMKVDYDAFRSWKSLDEALHYRWDVALWRWLQGAIIGGAVATGVFQAGHVSGVIS